MDDLALKDMLVAGRYKLQHRVGSGAFGEIYSAISIQSGSTVAVKLEPTSSKFPQLGYEYKLYCLLAGGVGIPSVRWYGREGSYYALVMEMLGSSLEGIFEQCNRKFTLKTVLMLADQMLARIEFVHERHYLHRDIKPDNFLVGIGEQQNKVYVIDFGLVKRYRDPKTLQHIPFLEGKRLTGTARYASINAHVGLEQGRRDDMEALGYVFMYFNTGKLPWQGLKTSTTAKRYTAIMLKKQEVPVDELCQGFPTEFADYIKYCRALKFDEKPDYAYLRGLFRGLFIKKHFTDDGMFDWIQPKERVVVSRPISSEEKEPPRDKLAVKGRPTALLVPPGLAVAAAHDNSNQPHANHSPRSAQVNEAVLPLSPMPQ